jgi:Fanconi-associated nuclease 1
MALNDRTPSQHNSMLTRWIKHPKSTNFDDVDDKERPAKRQHVATTPEPDVNGKAKSKGSTKTSPTKLKVSPTKPKSRRKVISDSDAEDDGGLEAEIEAAVAPKTDLESALPPVNTDKEAIEEYESFKASQLSQTAGESTEGAEERFGDRKWVRGKSSIYVDAFNLALDTVLDEESHLFDEAETEVFKQWRETEYEAQYLYVRLFLRKTATWHRIKTLGYHSDISDLDAAISVLQRVRELPTSSAKVEQYPGELEPPAGTTLENTFTLADRSEEEINTLEEASSLLKLDELKALAKDAKVQGQGKNKRDLLKALRRTSGKQVGLGYVGLKRSDTDSSRRSSASGMTPAPEEEELPLEEEDISLEANRDAHFTRRIMNETGPCIRLSLAPLKLFERVHLVFYRSSEWTEKSLTTIILAKIARRNFPEFIVSRSANIFASRSSLLEFEASLRTQFRVDNVLQFNGRPTDQGFQEIIDTFDEVYPRWKALLREEQQKEDSIYHSGEGAYLRRLSPAWVYTRIVHKATAVLARRKEHKREHEILTELLDQRLFHHSRRGAWYQRKTLLEEHYMYALSPTEGRNEEAQKKHWKRIGLQTCEDGLEDNLVHIIHHYDLQKRVSKLEKSLKVAKRAQHDFTHVRLMKPVDVTVEGIQILREEPSLHRRNSSPHPSSGRRGAKTIWIDPREGGECSVEDMCLSYYREHGWKGYHSEGGIVRTLFGYLFFDVLFTYVPNVFQTPYQTCPLDLHSDAFYPSRLSEINRRLNEISNGDAGAIIQRIYDAHHERRTCVVGLDWTFAIEDLLEIAACFEGQALATVCKVMAQEYGQRGGGVPDLFLWKVGEEGGGTEKIDEDATDREGKGRGDVKFAEVKSENDRLSDTQRLWIHVLSGAGVRVELTGAVAKEVRVVR